jgi:hypothetical protein
MTRCVAGWLRGAVDRWLTGDPRGDADGAIKSIHELSTRSHDVHWGVVEWWVPLKSPEALCILSSLNVAQRKCHDSRRRADAELPPAAREPAAAFCTSHCTGMHHVCTQHSLDGHSVAVRHTRTRTCTRGWPSHAAPLHAAAAVTPPRALQSLAGASCLRARPGRLCGRCSPRQ